MSDNGSKRVLREKRPVSYTTDIEIITSPSTPSRRQYAAQQLQEDEVEEVEDKTSDEEPITTAAPTGPPLKEAPVKRIANSDDMYTFFIQEIRDQATGIARLCSYIATALKTRQSAWGETKRIICKFVLAGTSGCGKTETVLRMKELLGMLEGYEYEHQCVDIDGSTMSDESQTNCLTGAGAGLVGYNDGSSLAHRLIETVEQYRRRKMPLSRGHQKKAPQARAQEKQMRDKLVPPYIMLFIDELDKVSNAFMLTVNGLLETGHYATPSGINFVLPAETVLFVVCTCNYGAEGISLMRDRQPDTAMGYIVEDMKADGLQPYTIMRLGQIIPFYPLASDILRALLVDKLVLYIKKSVIANKYGQGMIVYDDEVKNILIDHVMERVHQENGVRGGIKELFDKLNLLFDTALNVLDKMMLSTEMEIEQQETTGSQSSRGLLSEPIRITAHTIDTHKFGETVDQELKDVIRSIKSNPTNADLIRSWKSRSGDEGGKITTVGMTYEGAQLCQVAVNYTCNTYTSIHLHSEEESAVIIEKLREDKKELRKCIQEISAVNRDSQISGIINQKAGLLDSSEDSDEDERDSLLSSTGSGYIPLNHSGSPRFITGYNSSNSNSNNNNPSSAKRKRSGDASQLIFDTESSQPGVKKKFKIVESSDGRTQSLHIHEKHAHQFHTTYSAMNKWKPLIDSQEPMHESSSRVIEMEEDEEEEEEEEEDNDRGLPGSSLFSSSSDSLSALTTDEDDEGDSEDDISEQSTSTSHREKLIFSDPVEATSKPKNKNNGKGRPKKAMPGFTWLEIRHNRAVYQCDRCKATVGSRSTQKHKCGTTTTSKPRVARNKYKK